MSRTQTSERNRIGRTDSRPDAGRLGLHQAVRHRPVRKRSTRELFGLPLWEIAKGPDPLHGERRGHARAWLAVGDVADGLVALGGISRGVIAVGGISFGVFSLGGIAIGLAAGMGGIAAAPFAAAGVAFGFAAMGGTGIRIKSGRMEHFSAHSHRSRRQRRRR
jgi:hypothetical protein